MSELKHISDMCDELRPLVLTICPFHIPTCLIFHLSLQHQMFEAGFHKAGDNNFRIYKSCDLYEAVKGAYDMIKNPEKYEEDSDE